MSGGKGFSGTGEGRGEQPLILLEGIAQCVNIVIRTFFLRNKNSNLNCNLT